MTKRPSSRYLSAKMEQVVPVRCCCNDSRWHGSGHGSGSTGLTLTQSTCNRYPLNLRLPPFPGNPSDKSDVDVLLLSTSQLTSWKHSEFGSCASNRNTAAPLSTSSVHSNMGVATVLMEDGFAHGKSIGLLEGHLSFLTDNEIRTCRHHNTPDTL